MQVGLVRNSFDYYEIEIPVGKPSRSAILSLPEIQAVLSVIGNKLNGARELQEMYSFGIIPGFAAGLGRRCCVSYQIFVDRFCNGDPSNVMCQDGRVQLHR